MYVQKTTHGTRMCGSVEMCVPAGERVALFGGWVRGSVERVRVNTKMVKCYMSALLAREGGVVNPMVWCAGAGLLFVVPTYFA
jgi:hypothetical protein